jgi:hypothetical protein
METRGLTSDDSFFGDFMGIGECDAGVFVLKVGGWRLERRQLFVDGRSAMEWMRAVRDELRRDCCPYAIRFSVCRPPDSLRGVLAEYESFRLERRVGYC